MRRRTILVALSLLPTGLPTGLLTGLLTGLCWPLTSASADDAGDGGPDLEILTLDPAATGSTVQLDWTVVNQGDDSDPFTSVVQVYAVKSCDAVGAPLLPLKGMVFTRMVQEKALASDGTEDASVSTTLPNGVYDVRVRLRDNGGPDGDGGGDDDTATADACLTVGAR
jgi:hypothetical protein